MTDKVSKQQAHYSEGMKSAHCGICKHFEKPNGCEIVAGDIKSDMWCEFFKAKRKKRRRIDR